MCYNYLDSSLSGNGRKTTKSSKVNNFMYCICLL